MQEVEVLPRDVFIHYIHVPKGKTILWWFSTKRKNISFGLYRRTTPAAVSTSNIFISTPQSSNGHPAPSFDSLLSPAAYRPQSLTPTKKSRASLHSVSSAVSRTSVDTETDENEELPGENVSGIGTSLPDTSTTSVHSTLNSPTKGRKKSVSVQVLNDPDMKEILPIEHYNSSSTTIKGSYLVHEDGMYCLCFDNSFSRKTSKLLTFFVALRDEGSQDEVKTSKSDISGWMLKKKRKKMQGWAKRWVRIEDGILSYYQHPYSPCRGTIYIVLSTVSSNRAFRSIHMDSGTATYHLKTLTNEDFDKWMAVIRKYVNLSKERQLFDPDYSRITSPRQSIDLSRRASLYKRQSIIDRRQSLYRDSIFIRTETGEELAKIRGFSSSMDNSLNTVKEVLDALKMSIDNPPSPNIQRAHTPTNEKFRIRKPFISLGRHTSSTDAPSPTSPTPPNLGTFDLHEKLNTTYESLKRDKDQLFEFFASEAHKWKAIDNAYRKLVTEHDELRKYYSELQPTDSEQTANDISTDKFESIEDASYRAQSLTSNSEIFFDAEDIVLSHDTEDEDDSDADEAIVEVIEEESEAEELTDAEQEDITGPLTEINAPAAIDSMTIQRRKNLPYPVCGDSVSFLSILKKNVGKDLSTITMPISLNEPINLLQKLAEELEYSDLLHKAASLSNSMDRLIHVAAFAVSGFASSQYRIGRKPFNPLHGETYEFLRQDKGFRFISEKVSHHPPIMACHAEAEDWVFWQDSKLKTKFWGKSMELISFGKVNISIPKHGDHFSFNKPSTWIRNMMSNKYLEHAGVMRVENLTTGEACEITFYQSGMFSNGPKNDINGVLLDSNKKKVGSISGKWNEVVYHEIGPNQLEVIWKASKPPPDHEQYYGFTQYAIELNELTDDIKDYLPNTDTRWRPDQRLFEEGDVENAELEKLRIEQKQREYRKFLEKAGQKWEPQWFKLKDDGWVYSGDYWETRERKAFEKKIELW
ncbi:3190_t:CDS:2 [Paraglomus occultum]|uniref:3190_t:CDS:1 n=1 Tax=Paraglomus occultum TaxID=144539 RepID=A0A9N8WEL3_9GLOM|nr:3190_t:CDS:2 [Paraglomus occultum]